MTTDPRTAKQRDWRRNDRPGKPRAARPRCPCCGGSKDEPRDVVLRGNVSRFGPGAKGEPCTDGFHR